MPINTGLAHLSNGLLLTAVVIYAVAMLAFAGDFAFGKKPKPAVARARVRELVSARAVTAAADSVAVGGPVAEDAAADDGLADELMAGGAVVEGAGPGGAGPGGAEAGAAESDQRAGRGPVGFWVTTAVVLT